MEMRDVMSMTQTKFFCHVGAFAWLDVNLIQSVTRVQLFQDLRRGTVFLGFEQAFADSGIRDRGTRDMRWGYARLFSVGRSQKSNRIKTEADAGFDFDGLSTAFGASGHLLLLLLLSALVTLIMPASQFHCLQDAGDVCSDRLLGFECVRSSELHLAITSMRC